MYRFYGTIVKYYFCNFSFLVFETPLSPFQCIFFFFFVKQAVEHSSESLHFNTTELLQVVTLLGYMYDVAVKKKEKCKRALTFLMASSAASKLPAWVNRCKRGPSANGLPTPKSVSTTTTKTNHYTTTGQSRRSFRKINLVTRVTPWSFTM